MDKATAKDIKENSVQILKRLYEIYKLSDDKQIQDIIGKIQNMIEFDILEEQIFSKFSELDDLYVISIDEISQLKLSSEEAQKIEEQVYSKTSNQRKKVARIVGECLFDDNNKKVPGTYYAHIIRELVVKKKLHGFGNLNRIRFSEVCRNQEKIRGE